MANTPLILEPLDALQIAVAADYDGGAHAHITNAEQAKEVGDTLFSFVIAEAGDAQGDAVEAIRMIESAARQLTELAQSLQARVDAKCAEDAAKVCGPQIALRFHPQAWQNDYAIEVDPEGETEFQVPLSDIDLGGNSELPRDDQYETDDLRHHSAAPKWIKDWSGPFYIEITNRGELEAHLEGQGVRPKAPKP